MDELYSRAAMHRPAYLARLRGDAHALAEEALILIPKRFGDHRPVYGHSTSSAGGGPHDAARRRARGRSVSSSGCVLDEGGRPVPTRWSKSGMQCRGSLSGTWSTSTRPRRSQLHRRRSLLTDAGGNYQYVSIKPGAYPWRNHANAWVRPTSTSRCSDPRF